MICYFRVTPTHLKFLLLYWALTTSWTFTYSGALIGFTMSSSKISSNSTWPFPFWFLFDLEACYKHILGYGNFIENHILASDNPFILVIPEAVTYVIQSIPYQGTLPFLYIELISFRILDFDVRGPTQHLQMFERNFMTLPFLFWNYERYRGWGSSVD